jgi:Phage integrase family
VRQQVATGANQRIQGTILKKCDRSNHNPQRSKACAARDAGAATGRCQHTCEPGEIEACRHAWTVRYSAAGRQREESFEDELYPGTKRVKPNSGLRKAQDFQLKLSAGKREQGRSFTDPKEGDTPFIEAAAQFIKTSSRLRASEKSRAIYLGLLNGDIATAFEGRTLAQMATQEAADEVAAFLNTTIAHRSMVRRQHARMIIVWTMDAAVNADKIGRHKLTGITLAEGTAVPRRQRAAEEDDDESAAGFVFITDDQVRMLAYGGTFPAVPGARSQRPRQLQGVGIAAWLQRTMGLRIREALGAEKRDFRTRRDGSHYLRLRSQATVDGTGREPLKHRKEGQGRDVPVPDFIWNMVAGMPDGPLCPGPNGTRYMPYYTARGRFDALTAAMQISGYTTHSIRHQFATEALDDGANIANIAAVLGHRTVETTLRIYVHPTEDAETRMREMMNARWGTRPAAGTKAA